MRPLPSCCVTALLLLGTATVAAQSPVTDAIDWDAYLARHDPIWRWYMNTSQCTTGYTQLNHTIKHESAPSCSASQCTSAETCVDEAASQCDACSGCSAFGLCPEWHNGTMPQLFGNTTPYIVNPGWTTWTKGGSALSNHSSCYIHNAAEAWEDGAFFGNGVTGGILRVGGGFNALHLDIGRNDVWDRRAEGSEFAIGENMWDRPRLPVGYTTLTTRGNITAGCIRVHLANATLAVSLQTTAGVVQVLLTAHFGRLAIIAQWNATGGEAPDPVSGAGGFGVALVPLPGNSTRSRNPPAAYRPNPPPACNGSAWGTGAVRVCTQTLLAGGNYATALSTRPAGKGPASYFTVLHIASDWPASSSPATAAAVVETTAAACVAQWDGVLAEQAGWWAGYWRESFLSIPATAVEGMYALQVYKYACATRPNGTAIDLMGPWWQPSGWELYWCVEWAANKGPWCAGPLVTYWFPLTAGRFGHAATLVQYVTSNVSQLAANVLNNATDGLGWGGAGSYDAAAPYAVHPGQMLGNFPWICHNLYLHARYTADAALMRGTVFPLLRGAVNVYLRFLVTGADGLLHLPPTSSPEYPYPAGGPTNDTHYDLALLAWGARTLLALDAELHPGAPDPAAPAWARVVAALAPFPLDPRGFGYEVSAGVPFDVPHRHFSHLFAIYPLHLTTWEAADGGTPASRALMAASLDRWTGLTCTGGTPPDDHMCPNGFTFVGAASMSALMADDDGRRAAAVGNITGFVRSGLMHASTLYSEGHSPCFESPPGIAASLQEVLLQSWGGRLRLFPAVPDAWPDAVIHGLAAEGGLRVSAVRAGGATEWVAVLAVDYTGTEPAGATRRVVAAAAGLPPPPLDTSPPGVALAPTAAGDVAFDVPVGGTVVLYRRGAPAVFRVQALPGNASEFNYWGMH